MKSEDSNYLLNKQILSVGFLNNDGLELKWDFKGLTTSTVQRRHIFICLSTNKKYMENLIKIAQKCYETIRYGDYYTVRFLMSRKYSWEEKLKINKFSFQYKAIKNIIEKEELKQASIKFMQEILTNESSKRLPTLITVITDPQIKNKELQNIFQKLQILAKNSLIFIISENIKIHKKQTNRGLYWFPRGYLDSQQYRTVYNKITHMQSCFYAVLKIVSLNTDIYLNEHESWEQVDCNTISRKIKGPLSCNYYDFIDLWTVWAIEQTNCETADTLRQPKKSRLPFEEINKLRDIQNSSSVWHFKAIIQYKLLNENIYVSQKQIQFNIQPSNKINSMKPSNPITTYQPIKHWDIFSDNSMTTIQRLSFGKKVW